MNRRLCIRLGLVTGGAVGALVGLLHGFECCTPPHPPTWAQLALDGLVVALIAGLISAAFAWLVTHFPAQPVFVLAFLISIVVGVLLGPLAYHIKWPWLALLLCAILGALLGWLVCRLICGGRKFNLEVSR
jgi:MFS family permease